MPNSSGKTSKIKAGLRSIVNEALRLGASSSIRQGVRKQERNGAMLRFVPRANIMIDALGTGAIYDCAVDFETN